MTGGNHGSRIGDLPPAKRAKARALVLEWAGLGAADPAAKALDRTGHPRRVPALDTVPDYARPPLP